MLRAQDDVVLITGALSGIGLASAERMHRDGATVILTDISAPGDARVTGVLNRFDGRARYLRLDVTNEDDWAAAAADVRAKEGLLDALVHNAGMSANGYVETLDLEAWRKVQALNSDSIFMGTKAFTTLLAKAGESRKGGASIVIISSILGIVGFATATPYNASKGAARLFSKAAAIEYASRKMPIRVNSVHPGFVATPLTLNGLAEIAQETGLNSADPIIAQLNEMTPMGRMGEPEEIANVVAFLCSTESSYMTGSELVVDGGYTAR